MAREVHGVVALPNLAIQFHDVLGGFLRTADFRLGGLRGLGMTVEDPSVIDFVAHDPKSDVVLFVMVEHREWGDQGKLLPELQTKLNTDLGYVLDGRFGKAYSQYVGKRLVFDLRTAHPPGSREMEFLEVVRTQELGPRGIGLTWRQYHFPDDLPSESESSGAPAEETNQ